MTQMLPPKLHPAFQSRAERKVFRRLQDAPGTQNWICIHSLGLAHHEKKRRAEADFLLLTPLGIFVLEIKGGKVQREEGVWKFTDRHGETTEKCEGPFDQANGAMFALIRRIQELGHEYLSNLLFGSGVMFPDITFDEIGVEGDQRQVYDIRTSNIVSYIRGLSEYTRGHTTTGAKLPTVEDVQELRDVLRGDFSLEPSLSVLLEHDNEELEELAANRVYQLDVLESRPRVVFQGAAGTGKLRMAVEATRQELDNNRRTLLVCPSPNCAAWMRDMVGRAISRGAHSKAALTASTPEPFRSMVLMSGEMLHVRGERGRSISMAVCQGRECRLGLQCPYRRTDACDCKITVPLSSEQSTGVAVDLSNQSNDLRPSQHQRRQPAPDSRSRR